MVFILEAKKYFVIKEFIFFKLINLLFLIVFLAPVNSFYLFLRHHQASFHSNLIFLMPLPVLILMQPFQLFVFLLFFIILNYDQAILVNFKYILIQFLQKNPPFPSFFILFFYLIDITALQFVQNHPNFLVFELQVLLHNFLPHHLGLDF